MSSTKQRITALVAACLLVIGATLTLVTLALAYGSEVESVIYPVNGELAIQSVAVDGRDAVVVAQLVKHRSCQFVPPTLAEADGRFLPVECVGATCGLSWPPSDTPRTVTWRILGGAGVEVSVSQQHVCHPLWRTFSYLGTIDARP